MDSISQLIHLRAVLVRLANEIEDIAEDVNGKGMRRVRERAANIARRMRSEAMSSDAVTASKRHDRQTVDPP